MTDMNDRAYAFDAIDRERMYQDWKRINRQRKEQEIVLRRILDHLDRWYGHHDERPREGVMLCHWCEFRRDIRRALGDD